MSETEELVVTEKEMEESEKKYGAGGFFMLYKNEEENAVRQFAVDFTALNSQAENEGFSKDTYSGVLYGFESAVRVMLSNYNIVPRKTPIDSMAESEKLTELFAKAVQEEEKKQNEEQAGTIPTE